MTRPVFLAAALVAGLGFAGSAFVPGLPVSIARAAEADTVRPELGKVLQAVQEMIKAHKDREALARLREADAIADKTPYEIQIVEQLRLAAAIGTGEGAIAAHSYEALAAAGRVSAADLQRYALAIAGSFYQAKDYANAALWSKRYLGDGGSDPAARDVLLQSYYLAGDSAAVVKTVGEWIKAGDHPSAARLQMLALSYRKLGDGDNYVATMEKLVALDPKPEYWDDLIARVTHGPHFADRLALDAARFSQAVGLPVTAEQCMERAELALQAGLPGEAQAIIADGYAKGILGTGADADRQRRLKDMADRNAASDRAALDQAEREGAAAADGNALVATGLDYWGYGQADKAADLIRRGIAKGGLKYPDDARLHLALALIRGGHAAEARDALRQVGGSDGAADLARLWLADLAHAG